MSSTRSRIVSAIIVFLAVNALSAASSLANEESTVGMDTFTLQGSGYISNAEGGWTAAGLVTEEESVGLPVPLLGLSAEYHITPKWRTRAGVRYFTLSLDEWTGSILEGNVNLEYLFHKNFGIGTGYTYFNADVERDRTTRVSELDYTYNGVQIYGILYF